MKNYLRRNFTICFRKPTKEKLDDKLPPGIIFRKTNPLHRTIADELLIGYESDESPPPDFTSNSLTQDSSSEEFSSPTDDHLPFDVASVLSSGRFFFSPGKSNSLIIEGFSHKRKKPPPPLSSPVVEGGVAITTYSPDPYSDFRLSMQEMAEANDLDISEDWNYLQEMLGCYLKLNSKRTHKYIVGAFADLLMNLMARRRSDLSGGYAILR